MTLSRKNTFPYDYTSAGTTSITGATESLVTASGSGELLAMAYNTNNNALYVGYNGIVTSLANKGYAYYDFATDGGAIGTITLRGTKLPKGARITRAWYEVQTTFTSATDAATIAIGIPTDDATGIVGATAISAGGNVWDAGLHEAIQTGTAATMSEKTTAERALTATIAVEVLTAGKFVLVYEYDILNLDTTD